MRRKFFSLDRFQLRNTENDSYLEKCGELLQIIISVEFYHFHYSAPFKTIIKLSKVIKFTQKIKEIVFICINYFINTSKLFLNYITFWQ